MSCWTAQPQERPVFTSLVNKLFDLLDRDSNYLKLHTLACMEFHTTRDMALFVHYIYIYISVKLL